MAKKLARHADISTTMRYAHLSDEELDKGFQVLSQKVGQDVQALRRFHEDNNMVGSFRQSLLEEKVLDFVIEGSVVKEVEADELTQKTDTEVKS